MVRKVRLGGYSEKIPFTKTRRAVKSAEKIDEDEQALGSLEEGIAGTVPVAIGSSARMNDVERVGEWWSYRGIMFADSKYTAGGFLINEVPVIASDELIRNCIHAQKYRGYGHTMVGVGGQDFYVAIDSSGNVKLPSLKKDALCPKVRERFSFYGRTSNPNDILTFKQYQR